MRRDRLRGAADRIVPRSRRLNAHTEFPDPQHLAICVAVAHEQRVPHWISDLAADACVPDPDQLADDLPLVLNGVHVTATFLGPQGPAQRTIELARRLICTASTGSRTSRVSEA